MQERAPRPAVALFTTMQENEKSKEKGFGSMSKGLMVAGIVLLLGVIGVLVYMSQPKPTETPTAQPPEPEASTRTKEAIGVFSSIKPGDPKGSNKSAKDSTETSSAVLKGETSNSFAADDNKIKGTPFLTGDLGTPVQDANSTDSRESKSAAPHNQANNNSANKPAVVATPEAAQPEKGAKTAPPAHKKKHRRNAETFFEIAPGSGTHKRDELDYVAP